MTNISIVTDYEKRITRRADRNDAYDRDDTATDHTIMGFEVVGDDSYKDFSVSFNPVPDRDYYLLMVIYDTGDSFGRDAGQLSLIDLYENQEMAADAAKAIRAHANNDDYDFNLKLIAENGVERSLYTPWKGYFESIQSIEVRAIRMNSRKWKF